MVSNQPAVARGLADEATVQSVNKRMRELLASQGAGLTDIYYCPHHPQGKIRKYTKKCSCRKPEPGLILQAAAQHNLDLGNSVMVGDRATSRSRRTA